MLNEFLIKTNKTYDKTVINDVQRALNEIGLTDMKAPDLAEKLNQLAESYKLLKLHCQYLAQYKGYTDSFFHKELTLLEDYIKYIARTYNLTLPFSFEKLISTEENTNQKQDFKLEFEDF